MHHFPQRTLQDIRTDGASCCPARCKLLPRPLQGSKARLPSLLG